LYVLCFLRSEKCLHLWASIPLKFLDNLLENKNLAYTTKRKNKIFQVKNEVMKRKDNSIAEVRWMMDVSVSIE